MQITVNGEPHDVTPGLSITALLQTLGLNPKTIVVQRNGNIVEQKDFDQTLVQEGDSLDLVRFVGGG